MSCFGILVQEILNLNPEPAQAIYILNGYFVKAIRVTFTVRGYWADRSLSMLDCETHKEEREPVALCRLKGPFQGARWIGFRV